MIKTKILGLCSILFSLLFPVGVRGELHPSFEEMMEISDWIVIGEMAIDDQVEVAIHIRDQHFDPVRKTVSHLADGEIVTERVFYSRSEIDGIPAKYPIAIWKVDVEKYPVGEIAVWALMYNSLHNRYHAFWLDPEIYSEVRTMLDELTEKKEENGQEPEDASE